MRGVPIGTSSKSAQAMWQYARYRCIRCSSNLDLSSAIVARSATECDKTRESPGEIATPPMLSRLLERATSWTANLDLSLSKSNLDFVAIDASETAHASAKNTVYGVISRDTHGLLLCFRTSKKKKPSPAIGAPFNVPSALGPICHRGLDCLRCPMPRRRRRLQALLRTTERTA